MSNTQKIIKKQAVRRIIDEMKRFQISVDDILEENGEIAVTWSTEDIDYVMEYGELVANPPLSREEKLQVLKRARERHDGNVGISYDVLKVHLMNLYKGRLAKRG